MSDNIDYSKRIIAFVDILGFKEIIRESDKDTSKIITIYEVLDYLKKLGDSIIGQLIFYQLKNPHNIKA